MLSAIVTERQINLRMFIGLWAMFALRGAMRRTFDLFGSAVIAMAPSTSAQDIVAELEAALRGGSDDRRNEILQRVTDLFLGDGTRYSDSDAGVFDEVMSHLISHVESRALVELSKRLAPVANAPLKTVRRLAGNDAIDISGPVLAQSVRLNDDDLIEIAKTKSQAHLATIARRPQVNEAVTEALVEYGDAEVATEVASNAGAAISNLTMAKLAMRAEGDERLTGAITRRSDVTRRMFRTLMAQATEMVRARLVASAKPAQRDVIQQVLDDLAKQVTRAGAPAFNYSEAQRDVAVLSQDAYMTRAKLMQYARGRYVTKMVVALSVLSGVPVEQVHVIMHGASDFGLLALCRSIMLDWKTACAVIDARPGRFADDPTAFEFEDQFKTLSPASAQQLIRHWQQRQGAGEAGANAA